MLWISDRTTKVGIYKSKHGQCLYVYILQHLLFSTLIFKAHILSSMLFFAYCNLSWFLEIRELLKVIASTFAS